MVLINTSSIRMFVRAQTSGHDRRLWGTTMAFPVSFFLWSQQHRNIVAATLQRCRSNIATSQHPRRHRRKILTRHILTAAAYSDKSRWAFFWWLLVNCGGPTRRASRRVLGKLVESVSSPWPNCAAGNVPLGGFLAPWAATNMASAKDTTNTG